jgi:hypothetical protein
MTLDASHITRLHTPQHEPGNGVAQFPGSCGSRSGIRWHCAWTKQGREQQAAKSINAAGFTSYLPLFRQYRGQGRCDIGPLFPRYCFVAFDPTRDAWGVIANCRGVCGLIRHGYDLPTTLPDAAILALQARTSLAGFVDDPGETPWKLPGDDYSPIWVPMAGLDAGARTRLLCRLFGVSAARIVAEDAA